ncbi:hypothetical protein HHK36_027028 [Tetracentron sinense]|uniref:Ankyrin repeat domain-containing protein n=1 Tax=Tetracentron sinense TaxID=13715 RepID=A0A834YGN1_TETSI|nr:hypothetical protein HHK36_027028 [Tetracentron sinense]
MVGIDISKYAHSPVHKAVATRDYAGLRRILAVLPRLCNPAEIRTEAASVAEEEKADAISFVIDSRDVPNRETPLHLAVKLGDETATEMLMVAGADWSLQNEQGWSALQEAICNREEGIAMIIVRHYQPLAWAKWCRRLPRLIGTMRRMRDFYMEITFNFESSVIPFISRIAPSDTYKIWKRGSNLRADMTLAGFDGFRIQRSDQSILFLGDGSEDGTVPPGSLCMLSHKDKEVTNALDGAGSQATEAEVQQEVAAMSQTNIFRPGIDVTQAVLLPQLTWRRQEKAEMVGPWKAKVYDMHNVVVSVKSRRVPGAMTDDEFFSSCNDNDNDNDIEGEDYNDLLTEDERRQLDVALKLDSSDLTTENGLSDGIIEHRHSCYEQREIPVEDLNSYSNGEAKQERKGWFGGWRKRDSKHEERKKLDPPRSSLCVDEKVSNLLGDSPSRFQSKPGRHSVEIAVRGDELQRGRGTKKSSSTNSESGHRRKDGNRESEYKKGLRPILWLSPNFQLQTEELLPLLDILANKVKAIRRLRELLTTKLPSGTFPVKVAIPVVPTIRVLVTFTKFEELQPMDEFCTPPSSPRTAGRESPAMMQSSSSSWFQWIKSPYNRHSSSTTCPTNSRVDDIQDLCQQGFAGYYKENSVFTHDTNGKEVGPVLGIEASDRAFSAPKMADMKGSASTNTDIRAMHKEWDEASCPICMEHPHNAVLLLCSSHDKGCRSYICDTSYRHSNCLDRFKKPRVDFRNSPSQSSSSFFRNPDSVELSQGPFHGHTSELYLGSGMRNDFAEAHGSYSLNENSDGTSTGLAEALGENSNHDPDRYLDVLGGEDIVETGDPELFRERIGFEELGVGNLSEPSLSLKCPLCRGTVQGWKIVKEARQYLDLKQRSCSRESCSFFGNYSDLRRHARRVHPTTRPAEVDPSRQRAWRHLEHQREYSDIVSAIRLAMPGAVVLGDYVIENGDELSGDREIEISSDEGSGPWWTTFFLFQMISPSGPAAEPRGQMRAWPRYRRSSGAFSGRRNLWGENLLGLQEDDEDWNISSNMGEDVPPIPRRRRRFTQSRPNEEQP